MNISGCPSITCKDLSSFVSGDLSLRDNLFLLDVREEEEFEFTSIPNSLLIPLGFLESKYSSIMKEAIDKKIIVICRSGQRSAMATKFLLSVGFTEVYNLDGGLLEYSKIDPSIKAY